jgi:hypothetical protein
VVHRRIVALLLACAVLLAPSAVLACEIACVSGHHDGGVAASMESESAVRSCHEHHTQAPPLTAAAGQPCGHDDLSSNLAERVSPLLLAVTAAAITDVRPPAIIAPSRAVWHAAPRAPDRPGHTPPLRI